jgi:hypothetical protein
MRICLFLPVLLVAQCGMHGQTKKPLDPSVYDGWQNVNEKILSLPTENMSFIPSLRRKVTGVSLSGQQRVTMQRKYHAGRMPPSPRTAGFSSFLSGLPYKDIREARIRKKTPDQSPKIRWHGSNWGRTASPAFPGSGLTRFPNHKARGLAYLLEKPCLPAARGRENGLAHPYSPAGVPRR